MSKKKYATLFSDDAVSNHVDLKSHAELSTEEMSWTFPEGILRGGGFVCLFCFVFLVRVQKFTSYEFIQRHHKINSEPSGGNTLKTEQETS